MLNYTRRFPVLLSNFAQTHLSPLLNKLEQLLVIADELLVREIQFLTIRILSTLASITDATQCSTVHSVE